MDKGYSFVNEGSIHTDIVQETVVKYNRVLNVGADKYCELRRGSVFFDKTMLISYTNSVIETAQKYICFSRPRRFGKTAAADMLNAYYDRTVDGKKVFTGLKISSHSSFDLRRNKYDVIFLNMQDFLSESSGFDDFMEEIKRSIIEDLVENYNININESITEILQETYRRNQRKFVFIVDEWDCIFRERKENIDDQKLYLDFLRNIFKDKSYIALVYMTGILPIKKYGTHSALNMFDEFSMENPGALAEYVGLIEEEVKEKCEQNHIDFEECKRWYDGYSFRKCSSVYNPKSVITLLRTGEFGDYWNRTESYEALKEYISLNYDGVRDIVIALMASEHWTINTGSFTNDMTTFNSADDIMTLLIHLGYLGYDIDKREVFIPNKEILQEFVTTTTSTKWPEVVNSIGNSRKLLEATLNKDEKAVAEYIEKAHLDCSHLTYNDENSLSCTISLAFYAARDHYRIVRELPTGKGFADIVFLPLLHSPYKKALVVELKWDKSAQTALDQIKDKQYPDSLKGISDGILLVGINYDKKTRKHTCIIEEV